MRALTASLSLALLATPALSQEFTPYNLFVGNNSTQSVLELDSTATQVGEFNVGSGVRAVTFGPDGNLYASRFNGDRVHVIDSEGNEVTQIGNGSNLDGAWGVTFGPNGLLYVASTGTDSVIVFDRNGNEVNEFSDASLDNPRYIAISPDNILFLSSHNNGVILQFDLQGNFLGNFDTSLGNPEGMCFSSDGKLYATSTNRVHVYDADGTELDAFGTGFLNQAHGLTIAPNGNIFVASFITSSIFEFDPAGNMIREIDGGNLGQVHGLAISPKRALAKISGTSAKAGSLTKMKLTGTWSIFPGQATIMLELNSTGPFNLQAAVFQGFTISNSADGKKQSAYGQQSLTPASLGNTLSVSLAIAGTPQDDGSVAIKKAKGFMHGANAGEIFSAKVAVSKPLN